MTKVEQDITDSFDEMASYVRGELPCETYPFQEPDIGHYPGWLTALVWIGLWALGMAPIILALYLTWSWI
jgi:hypothetical protein